MDDLYLLSQIVRWCSFFVANSEEKNRLEKLVNNLKIGNKKFPKIFLKINFRKNIECLTVSVLAVRVGLEDGLPDVDADLFDRVIDASHPVQRSCSHILKSIQAICTIRI